MADAALAPPRKSVELEDPGAHELESSEGESDSFQDASEGGKTGSKPASPVPVTRVEKVDDEERHGETPGTEAYKMREKDAVPDEIEIVPDGQKSRSNSSAGLSHRSPRDSLGSSVPKTVVDKVDPLSPSHGDVPGTPAFSTRQADAVPDEVRGTAESQEDNLVAHDQGSQANSNIPTTVITKVDSEPRHGEVPGTAAYDIRTQDAQPDIVEKRRDIRDVPTSLSHRSSHTEFEHQKLEPTNPSSIAADGGFGPMRPAADGKDNLEEEDEDADGDFGDDFDEFEAGGEVDDDFGDFDEGLEEPSKETQRPPPAPDIPFDIPDFSQLHEPHDYIPYLSALFPNAPSLPPANDLPPPSRDKNPIFPSQRSLSLWHQLSTPPPLQPPNWLRSRIRRLFLVSLGVPVDLDEILPKSKQGRLVLPSMERITASGKGRMGDNESASNSTTSLGSTAANGKKRSTGTKKLTKKGPPPPPELDISRMKSLASRSEAEVDELSDTDLQSLVLELEDITKKASQVLEYWLRRRDEAKGEKEAFEGVIENLVRHARKQNAVGKKGGKKK